MNIPATALHHSAAIDGLRPGSLVQDNLRPGALEKDNLRPDKLDTLDPSCGLPNLRGNLLLDLYSRPQTLQLSDATLAWLSSIRRNASHVD